MGGFFDDGGGGSSNNAATSTNNVSTTVNLAVDTKALADALETSAQLQSGAVKDGAAINANALQIVAATMAKTIEASGKQVDATVEAIKASGMKSDNTTLLVALIGAAATIYTMRR